MGEVRFERGVCQAILTSPTYVIIFNRALLNRDPHCIYCMCDHTPYGDNHSATLDEVQVQVL